VIFVTVGHQMPFDRLVRAIDDWAEQTGRDDIFAQIGKAKYRPVNFPFTSSMPPQEFMLRMKESSAVVAHAGTGTIIAALELKKPLLVLPRLSALGETRNDHQIPTAQRFADAGCILSAADEDQLVHRMDELESFQPRGMIEHHASDELISRLRQFIFNEGEVNHVHEEASHGGAPATWLSS
jgi:UDP-N-acetylglucosamine transferase subunit ALG13